MRERETERERQREREYARGFREDKDAGETERRAHTEDNPDYIKNGQ